MSHCGLPIAKHQQPLGRANDDALPPVDVLAGEEPGLLHGPAAGADRPGVVPGRQLLPGQRQIDGFYLAAVGADVRFPILQFIQGADGVNSPGSRDVPHAKGQGNLFGETVQQRVEGFEGPVVDDHAQAAELRVSAFVEADPLRQDRVDDARMAQRAKGVYAPR